MSIADNEIGNIANAFCGNDEEALKKAIDEFNKNSERIDVVKLQHSPCGFYLVFDAKGDIKPDVEWKPQDEIY